MDFPIDFVYSWVDGEKTAALRKQHVADTEQTTSDANTANRFRDNNEIFHAIQSVKIFAPWVRKIFIVTSMGQCPSWYSATSYPQIEVIDDSVLFGEEFASYLPVFNSHSIEALLHRIPGLSEHFVYFNDDMFLGDAIEPTEFFVSSDQVVVRTAELLTTAWATHPKPWKVYRGNVYLACIRAFGDLKFYNTAHQGRALLKSSCQACWDREDFGPLLLATVRAKFRTLKDVAPCDLFINTMLATGDGIRRIDKGVVINIYDNSWIDVEFKGLRKRSPKFYCINDDMDTPSAEHVERLRYLLSTSLPHQQEGFRATSTRLFGRCLGTFARQASALGRVLRSR